jgi:hypothetical protein
MEWLKVKDKFYYNKNRENVKDIDNMKDRKINSSRK